MNGVLLVSKKTYSFSRRQAVTEWKSEPYAIDTVKMPHDFELRLVNGDIELNSIKHMFPELELRWSESNKILEHARRIVPVNDGGTDIAWYVPDLKIAYVVRQHANKPDMMCVDSIDDIKKELD